MICCFLALHHLQESVPAEPPNPPTVQLIISAGMSILDESVVVNRPGGLVFINDGLGANKVCTFPQPTNYLHLFCC